MPHEKQKSNPGKYRDNMKETMIGKNREREGVPHHHRFQV